MSAERSKVGTNEKKSPDGQIYLNKNTKKKKNNWFVFYKILKKYNEIQLTKKQNGLEQSKNEKSSTLPRDVMIKTNSLR